MKVTVEVELGRTQGPRGDAGETAEALAEAIEGLGSVWVQHSHESRDLDETEYAVKSATLRAAVRSL